MKSFNASHLKWKCFLTCIWKARERGKYKFHIIEYVINNIIDFVKQTQIPVKKLVCNNI